MYAKALVLNQDYSPLTVCTLHRAFILVFQKKVEMLRAYDNFKLHTVNNEFEAPAVIRLFRYIHVPYNGIALTRQNVFKRDKFICQYCGSKRNLTVDHVIPRAKGGLTKWSNLATACRSCNTRKGDRLPSEAGLQLATKPFKPGFIYFLRESPGYSHKEWEDFFPVKPVR